MQTIRRRDGVSVWWIWSVCLAAARDARDWARARRAEA